MGSEMCIRDRRMADLHDLDRAAAERRLLAAVALDGHTSRLVREMVRGNGGVVGDCQQLRTLLDH